MMRASTHTRLKLSLAIRRRAVLHNLSNMDRCLSQTQNHRGQAGQASNITFKGKPVELEKY